MFDVSLAVQAAAPVMQAAAQVAHAAAAVVQAAASAIHAAASVVPALPLSFSIDMSGLMDQAAEFFNGLFPAFTPVIAIRLGLGIVMLVVGAIGGALAVHR